MATYPLSYVVLPEGLGGRTVTAERARRHVDGRELRPSEIVYVIHDADLEGRHWTLWLHSERELPEVCPAEPADTTAWLGNDGVVYERVDSRGVTRSGLEPRAHSHGAYRWWASDLGGPMRWPNVWHRCQGGLRRLVPGLGEVTGDQ